MSSFEYQGWRYPYHEIKTVERGPILRALGFHRFKTKIVLYAPWGKQVRRFYYEGATSQ